MIRHHWFLLALLAPAVGSAIPAAAAASDPLAPLVREALAHNLALSASRLDAERAGSEYTATLLEWLPAVRLESRASRLHDVRDLGSLIDPAYAALNRLTGSNAFPTNVHLTLPQANESHVRVTQPLFAEPLRASVSAARAARDGAREGFAADARRLAAEVQSGYLQYAALERVVDIQESALTLVTENERVAARLLANGTATPEAVHRARADRAEVEQALAAARQQAAAAGRELNRIVGRPLDTAIPELPDSAFDVPLEISADDAVRSALAHREELAQADAGIRAANAGVHAATGAFLPSIAAAFDLAWQGDHLDLADQDRAWMASVVASWDLFRGGSDVARRNAARTQAERARTARLDAAERIAVEVRDVGGAAGVARGAVTTGQPRSRSAARTRWFASATKKAPPARSNSPTPARPSPPRRPTPSSPSTAMRCVASTSSAPRRSATFRSRKETAHERPQPSHPDPARAAGAELVHDRANRRACGGRAGPGAVGARALRAHGVPDRRHRHAGPQGRHRPELQGGRRHR